MNLLAFAVVRWKWSHLKMKKKNLPVETYRHRIVRARMHPILYFDMCRDDAYAIAGHFLLFLCALLLQKNWKRKSNSVSSLLFFGFVRLMIACDKWIAIFICIRPEWWIQVLFVVFILFNFDIVSGWNERKLRRIVCVSRYLASSFAKFESVWILKKRSWHRAHHTHTHTHIHAIIVILIKYPRAWKRPAINSQQRIENVAT